MFASTKFAAVLSVLAAATAAVSAAPAKVFNSNGAGKVDIAIRPDITAPTAGAVWNVGSLQTITWDTSDIPTAAMNQTGLILLGYLEDGVTSEHLDLENPLASGFAITAGSVDVVVPPVDTRDDYVIVLFGDSGNTSPKFTITSPGA